MQITLKSSVIKCYLHKRNGERANITINDPIITVDEDIYHFQYWSTENKPREVKASAIIIGDRFYLHSLDSPALVRDDSVDFLLYGHPVMIEDLHCDDEVKVCLKLKYSSLKNKEDTLYYTYSV